MLGGCKIWKGGLLDLLDGESAEAGDLQIILQLCTVKESKTAFWQLVKFDGDGRHERDSSEPNKPPRSATAYRYHDELLLCFYYCSPFYFFFYIYFLI